MTRSALPQNLISNNGSLLNPFNDITTGWGAPSGGTLELNTTQYKTGNASVKLTATTPGGSLTQGYYAASYFPFRLKENKTWRMWVYVHGAVSDLSSIGFYVTSGNYTTNLLKAWSYTALVPGWNCLTWQTSDFTNTGESLNNSFTSMRLKVNPAAGKTCAVSFDDLRYNVRMRPAVVFAFDDGVASQYSAAYPILSAVGIRATMFVATDLIGTAGYITTAQADELYGAGWDISNHTRDHTNLTTIDISLVPEKITTARDWLLARGYTRSANFMSYPEGGYNDAIIAAAEAARVVMGKGATAGYNYFPSIYMQKLLIRELNTSTTLATAQGWIDTIGGTEQVAIIFAHNISDTVGGTYRWTPSDYQSLVNYAVSKRVECLTFSEVYNCLTNPRYQSVPPIRSSAVGRSPAIRSPA